MRRYKVKVGKAAADCIEASRFKYSNGYFAAGICRGLPKEDDLYVRFARNGDKDSPLDIFLRRDEALAVIAALSHALWADDNL